MHINGSVLSVKLITPDFLQDLVAAHDIALILCQITEQLKFLKRQRHVLAIYLYQMLCRIQRQQAEVIFGSVRLRSALTLAISSIIPNGLLT